MVSSPARFYIQATQPYLYKKILAENLVCKKVLFKAFLLVNLIVPSSGRSDNLSEEL